MNHDTTPPSRPGRLLRIGGQVQGVGFRPFVFRTATAAGLTGWVENRGAEVQLLWQGTPEKLDAALHTLLHNHPPLARPRLIEQTPVEHPHCGDFQIRSSRKEGGEQPHIPPDYFVCDECLAEFHDPANRRYRYPFINCTQCGPRYTLIDHLPYDRASTTMAGFPLCAACHDEYIEPHDRRFHAEPIACPECGPQLRFHCGGRHLEESAASVEAAVALLAQGHILALKGVGGYHLLCDARDERAVQRLRRRKNRPDKPLAVMFPQQGGDGLALLKQVVAPTSAEAQLLRSPLRPIVLCRKRPNDTLARGIAPGLDEIGAMLPYSPLHHLLCDAFAAPLVATSGNISGEPVITDEREAERRLGGIADGFVHHNRPIRRPADDPLYRTIDGTPRSLRLGRGNAPLELELPFTLEQPLLAVGGEMKNAVALAWEDRLVLSPHIGELHSPHGLRIFTQVIADLQQLYGISARVVVHDTHPDYHASRWARQCGLPAQAVLHHHAHASALYAEHWPTELESPWLVATWDGVGYGDDGTLWGGESLLGRPGEWRRFARFRPFRLPGGDKAGREPWRSALALALESDQPWAEAPAEAALLSEAWRRGLNSPQTSAVGRLFDAATALLGVCHRASYEGQAPMLLEALAGNSRQQIELPLRFGEEGLWQSDWAPLLPLLLEQDIPPEERAACFHHSLAAALCGQAQKAREQHGITTVGLAGGVFQNRYLVESLTRQLGTQGFTVRLAEKVPCNDGGLAWGQIIEAVCQARRPVAKSEQGEGKSRR